MPKKPTVIDGEEISAAQAIVLGSAMLDLQSESDPVKRAFSEALQARLKRRFGQGATMTREAVHEECVAFLRDFSRAAGDKLSVERDPTDPNRVLVSVPAGMADVLKRLAK